MCRLSSCLLVALSCSTTCVHVHVRTCTYMYMYVHVHVCTCTYATASEGLQKATREYDHVTCISSCTGVSPWHLHTCNNSSHACACIIYTLLFPCIQSLTALIKKYMQATCVSFIHCIQYSLMRYYYNWLHVCIIDYKCHLWAKTISLVPYFVWLYSL